MHTGRQGRKREGKQVLKTVMQDNDVVLTRTLKKCTQHAPNIVLYKSRLTITGNNARSTISTELLLYRTEETCQTKLPNRSSRERSCEIREIYTGCHLGSQRTRKNSRLYASYAGGHSPAVPVTEASGTLPSSDKYRVRLAPRQFAPQFVLRLWCQQYGCESLRIRGTVLTYGSDCTRREIYKLKRQNKSRYVISALQSFRHACLHGTIAMPSELLNTSHCCSSVF